ncbi:hypothetical protein ACWF0M_01530 [Kribbella sp. NPDC055110]
MSEPSCFDCGAPNTLTRLPHAWICKMCRRRRHYHPKPCPGCGTTRPLAYQSTHGTDHTGREHDRDDDWIVCASAPAPSRSSPATNAAKKTTLMAPTAAPAASCANG